MPKNDASVGTPKKILLEGTDPTCYQWTLGELSGEFLGYGVANDVTLEFENWEVISGDAPPVGALVTECEDKDVQCVESQEWTYGVDNTGTRFNDVATYCLELSDGSLIQWSQNGASTSWTQQLQEWSANIQAAASAAGLQWFVEPRFVNNANPSSIDGTFGANNTPSGLPGAPSSAIAEALVAGGMTWRYVNFQICPGQPVPVRAFRKTSALYSPPERELTAAGAILGPVNKFWLCTEKGQGLVWYKEDLITLAEAGEIPNCWEPCGTLALVDSPPDRACEFFFTEACDNNNSDLTADFTSLVTRRATVCGGEQIAVDYFVPDPTDPTALVDYTLVGLFVDCVTGEEIPLPVPPCEDFEIVELFSIENKTAGLRQRSWLQEGLITSGDAAAARDLLENFDFSQATTSDTIETVNTGALFDTDAVGGSVTIQIHEGWICRETPLWIRHYANSEGSILADIATCGSSEFENMYDFSKATVGILFTPSYQIPVGISKIRLANIDNGGVNSVWNIQSSPDGQTWANDSDALDAFVSTTEPYEICKKVKVCKPDGGFVDLISGLQIDPTNCYDCSIVCEQVATSQQVYRTVECNSCIESAQQITVGRPLNTVSWAYGGVEGDTLEEFIEAWEECNGKHWIASSDGTGAGEAHWICPAIDGAVLTVDGVEVEGMQVISPNPNAEALGCESEEALATLGCLDEQILCAIENIDTCKDIPTETCLVGSNIYSTGDSHSLFIGTENQDPTVTHQIVTATGTKTVTIPNTPLDKAGMISALSQAFNNIGCPVTITDTNAGVGSQINITIDVGCENKVSVFTVEGVASTQQSTPAIAVSDSCTEKEVVPTNGKLDEKILAALNTNNTLQAEVLKKLCAPQCAPQTFYKINFPEAGTIERQWLDSAVPVSGAVGTSYIDSFTALDSEGYPTHVNPENTTISSSIASTTNVTASPDQAISDFWIWLTEPTVLSESNSTAEASGVWLSEFCGSQSMVEKLNATYLNTGRNPIDGEYQGCLRVRLYHSDFSVNGLTRLQALTNGTWSNITAYPTKPTVEVVKGWVCDDGLFYSLDKNTVLSPEEYTCEDPRCPSFGVC